MSGFATELGDIHALASTVPGMDPQDYETAIGFVESLIERLQEAEACRDFEHKVSMDAGWYLAYERAVREVVERCWEYASRAEEAYDAGFDHGSAYKERELFEAEQALAAAREEIERMNEAVTMAFRLALQEHWEEVRDELAAVSPSRSPAGPRPRSPMTDLSRAEHAAPGSDAAIAAGCRCPVLDNCHGAGIPWPRTDGKDPTKWPSWYVREDCPLHGADSGWVNP